ncbi:MAG: hypothetical protein E6G34_06510 [Actinobacteria bacterium]|nr:MAG: hypothetical protein E6G34_06510 [Actinomycetota bacterium]
MPTAEQFLTDSSLSEAPYGPAKIARYQGKGRWQIFYVLSDGRHRRERPAMTGDVLAKQGASDFGRQRVNRIISEYPGG